MCVSLRVEVLLSVCVLSPWVAELYLSRDTLSVAHTFTEQQHTYQSRLELIRPILGDLFSFIIWTKSLNKGVNENMIMKYYRIFLLAFKQ